jgi:hypothetical protein
MTLSDRARTVLDAAGPMPLPEDVLLEIVADLLERFAHG